MNQLTVNAAIGALEIDDFKDAAPRHDDRALERAGLSRAGSAAEPQPFTQIGFPPPCNVADDDAVEDCAR